jgi:hypothetical protein
MITMLQAIAAKVGAEVQQDPHLKALSENVEPQKLVQQIAARENDT